MSARPLMVKPLMPHPALPDADWADCYELSIPNSDLTAIAAARSMLSRFPIWARLLIRVRDAITSLFGLKSSSDLRAQELEKIGFFPVVSKSDNQVVLGFDDRHLDFRVVIDVRDDDQGRRLVDATTLVRRNILLGRIYLAIITPFHRLIVATMLADLGKRLRAVSLPP
ncbi:uncharacterized protein DUF2867 [Rhizobium sp. ERR 922]|uniref:DUF2867 domain-containing protein n=1 Tax=unclassified Rhizobium TaxID=2613769 RepID=UPI0011ACFE31|nr:MULTISPECIES: DUF2867 domain-containing protein [unclassified Rhizobium]MCZ3375901.1 DUF2867 domain-containing protein [Rhizobium sp. AG207R]TWB52011.1 uncharacterized protein DUF2867 [Rhizobium sp. ERR 922]TWB94433.1 uncharacterized protein DUF2867 [Rhizobium sp. ERR 942]